MSHFLLYLLHYVIVRTVYDSLRDHGLSGGALFAIAVLVLLAWHLVAVRRWHRRRRGAR